MDKWIALLIGWNIALSVAFWVEADKLEADDLAIARHIVETHKRIAEHEHTD